MRRGKPVKWHIDRLTEAGTAIGAWAFPGGSECTGTLYRLHCSEIKVKGKSPPVFVAFSKISS